jgi:hypothetical protein
MMAAFPEQGTLKHMKTEALTYTLIASGFAGMGWLLTNVRVDLSFTTAFAWAAVVGLLAMLPISYRGLAKRMLGR